MYKILIFCLILLLFLFYIRLRRIEGFYDESAKIPKIIWTYWNNDNLPEFIQKCINTWKKHNSTYTINVITPSNLNDYIDIDLKSIKWNDSPARESDIVRLLLIEKYGGVWCDASIIMRAPLNINTNKQVFSYYLENFTTNPKYPVIESWFFAAIPNCKFVKAWKKAFFKLGNFDSVNLAVNHMRDIGVDFQKIQAADYLFIHIAAQYVMQKEMTIKEIQNTIHFKKAEDGPYKYLIKNGWNSEKAIQDLCNGNNLTDLIKLRSNERNIIGENYEINCKILALSHEP
jgi:hypothetical protein